MENTKQTMNIVKKRSSIFGYENMKFGEERK
jgi:hypothetical protein